MGSQDLKISRVAHFQNGSRYLACQLFKPSGSSRNITVLNITSCQMPNPILPPSIHDQPHCAMASRALLNNVARLQTTDVPDSQPTPDLSSNGSLHCKTKLCTSLLSLFRVLPCSCLASLACPGPVSASFFSTSRLTTCNCCPLVSSFRES